MIPKVVHYCWFGGNPLPQLAEKCIASWRKHCPDYEILRWDESNYDVESAPLYVRQAYEEKKWAFLTDYVRLQIVYEHGGIYLDTDVELRKPLEMLLSNRAFFGLEDGKWVNTGLGFGAEAKHPILKEIMEDYQNIPFVLQDGSYDQVPCPRRNTEVFLRHGLRQDDSMQNLDQGVLILPSRFLSPIDNRTRKMKRTKDMISIHYGAASWQNTAERKRWRALQDAHRREETLDYILHAPNRLAIKVLGDDRYRRMKAFFKEKR